jgi:hypothetical protein
MISGGRPEGSKRNLKFQSDMWHHFKHFQSKDFFFLVAFLSQHLNYSVIIIWKICNYIGSKNILIPFIILGARPTSTPGPKRDQLVYKRDYQEETQHQLRQGFTYNWSHGKLPMDLGVLVAVGNLVP